MKISTAAQGVEHCYRELMACLFVHNLHIHNTSGKKRGSATPLRPYRKVRRNAASPIGAGLPSFQGLRSFLHSCEIKSGSRLRTKLVQAYSVPAQHKVGGALRTCKHFITRSRPTHGHAPSHVGGARGANGRCWFNSGSQKKNTWLVKTLQYVLFTFELFVLFLLFWLVRWTTTLLFLSQSRQPSAAFVLSTT